MKAIIFLLCVVFFSSCVLLKMPQEKDFYYKYVELPGSEVKIGSSNEMHLPGDTIVELPSKRTFVVLAIRMKGDSTWVYYKQTNFRKDDY
jgi:hypothetical protein